jgi:plastocyanin
MRALLRAAAVSLIVGAAGALPAAADTLPRDVVVNVDDHGFDPSTIAIPVGGSVTWIEKGINVHTATSLGGAPQQFSTGGFGPQESRSLVFNTPGTYPYSSATDCLNGNNMPGFVCGVYYVLVVPPGGTPPAVGQVILPTAVASPLPVASPAPANSATITDSGISPASLTVPVGASVTWTNTGSQVHTATTNGTAPAAFDSGGLAPGQSSQYSFPAAGTYEYTSATDCLNHNATPGFNCGPYTVVVTGPAQ